MALHVPVAIRMRLRGTPLARLYAQAHVALYTLTAGRIGAAIRVASGARPPVLLLETIGRRSGAPRTTPLIYLADGRDWVVIAANAGHPEHPAWWLNLTAAPRATVQIGGERRAVDATAVEGPRRDELWRRFALMYDGLAAYQRQATRQFPVVVLSPCAAHDRFRPPDPQSIAGLTATLARPPDWGRRALPHGWAPLRSANADFAVCGAENRAARLDAAQLYRGYPQPRLELGVDSTFHTP